MRQKRYKELLLLQVISGFCDPWGFCFPGINPLNHLMRCKEKSWRVWLAWLIEQGYIKQYETYNPRRRKLEIDYQVNPGVIYIREEMHDYCQNLWDGAERDYAVERIHHSLFREKGKQPESLPESETESGPRERIQTQNQTAKSASTEKKSAAISHINAAKKQGIAQQQGEAPKQGKAQQQQGEAHDRTNESAAPIVKNDAIDMTPYHKPLPSPDLEDLATTIAYAVSTQISQARLAVATYSRDEINAALIHTSDRRDKGELAKPGGYFFSVLKSRRFIPAPPPPPKKLWVGDDTDQYEYETSAT
jgi:hypothetical protein